MITGHRSKHYTYLKELVPGNAKSAPHASPVILMGLVLSFLGDTLTGGVAPLQYHVACVWRVSSSTTNRRGHGYHGTHTRTSIEL